MDPSLLLELREVSVDYGSHRALREVSLSCRAGDLVGLLGPNGAGKSTLLRTAVGRVPRCGGEVRLGDQDPARLDPRKVARKAAMVPQDLSVPFEYRVMELVLMGRYAHLGLLGLESAADLEVARGAMRRAGIESLAERRYSTLSGGERQQVLLARALAQETPLLLLDEPTAHLDLGHQQQTLELLRELAAEGRAVVAALHDLNTAALYCPRLALLHEGRLIASGSPQEVLTEARIREVYGARVRVLPHPELPGIPQVTGLRDPVARPR